VYPFWFSINAKGGDCWNVYRQSVLVIDRKKNNDVGRFIGKVCIERKTTETHKVYRKNVPGWHQKSFRKTQMSKLEKLRRDHLELHADSVELHKEYRVCARVKGKFFQSSGEIAF
jgi:hypothetical protein